MEFFIKIFDDDIVALRLNGAADAAIDTAPAMASILSDMFRVEKEVFASQGRRGGGSWKQLKPDTIRRKGSGRILVDTETLMRSVTEPGAEFQLLNIDDDTIEFGTERPGAKTHQFGNESTGVPARPFIRFTGYDLERWQETIRRHLMAGYGRAD